MTDKNNPTKSRKLRLFQSDSKEIKIRLEPGKKFEVFEVSVVDAELLKPKKLAARLCGYGSGTCLALIDIE